jgi:hypothetical protein
MPSHRPLPQPALTTLGVLRLRRLGTAAIAADEINRARCAACVEGERSAVARQFELL